MIQIHQTAALGKMLQVTDLLSTDRSTSHIGIILTSFDGDYRPDGRLTCAVDAEDMKLACWDILNGPFEVWNDYTAGSIEDGLDLRILDIRRIKEDRAFIKITIQADPCPFSDEHDAAQKVMSFTLCTREARKMAQTLYCYIRDWEQHAFAERQRAMMTPKPAPARESGKSGELAGVR